MSQCGERSTRVRCRPLLLVAALAAAAPASSQAPAGVRMLRVSDRAWAGSSVNVVTNSRQTLFTDGVIQFAGFYDADGRLVLARRRLGSDAWETRTTAHRIDPADAHRSLSLVVDGAGVLHVAWGHHDSPLSYARGDSPGSLELGAPAAMTGQQEDRVTYPQFFRLPDGDLLFLYRDGESGRGRLVLNRYTTAEGRWSRVHANLVDGEGQASPYWGLAVDGRGTLHLAWNWRDTPDVATNHDLAYARSADGGRTWQRSDGTPYALPLTAANAEYALRIPQGRNLMNPPFVAADPQGRPFLLSYWSPTPDAAPQFQIVRHDGTAWRTLPVKHPLTPFSLAGTGTKRPPISRAVLLVDPSGALHVVYRDDSRGGRILVVSAESPAAESWRVTELTADSTGAWEPSYDPVQWDRLGQLHMLVQKVEQRDGADRGLLAASASPVEMLIWSPRTARFTRQATPLSTPEPGAAPARVEAAGVLALMQRVADWQLAHPSSHDPRGWERAPFLIGLIALDGLAGDRRYRDAALRQAEENGWQPGPRPFHADDHCVMQSYLQLYEQLREPRMIAPSRERLDFILAHVPTVAMDWDPPRSQDRWTWCDALFMAPMSWLLMAELTGDARYLDYMNKEWWATTERLYLPSAGWYFRDESFLDLREPNGKTIHWSRGNGWVFAGLSRVLGRLPKDHPDRPRYLRLFGEMAEAALAAQQPDGMWRPGLLDPGAHPARETSGSSFLTFGLAFGVNAGLLDRGHVEPAVRRAWAALAACVTPEGKLEHVQPIGDAPQGFDPHHTDTFGVGAFLLAGSEVHRLVGRQTSPPVAARPLYRDPVEDGAADPVVVYNPGLGRWWMFYTNRRARTPGLGGVAWVHGTAIGMAESRDGGASWTPIGTAEIPLPVEIGGGEPTLWAPDVFTTPDGRHHMFVTVVPGVFEDWQHPRSIVHLVSDDLRHWREPKLVALRSDRVIDASVLRLADGTWRLFYNDERDRKSIAAADSPDLATWTDRGKVVGDQAGEGPKAFRWKGAWWMVTDVWHGLAVYRSSDALRWERQAGGNLLEQPGLGPDDGVKGGHADVVVSGDRAYLFYFTHPGRVGPAAAADGYEQRRSSIQVVELKHDNGRLSCDRDAPTLIRLVPPGRDRR